MATSPLSLPACRIGLDQTDAAGVLFTGAAITMAHAAYEEALAQAGADLAEIIRAGAYALPIRHCSADFSQPIYHGDVITPTVTCVDLRERSYEIQVSFFKHTQSMPAQSDQQLQAARSTLCASVRLVIVAIEPQARSPMALPTVMRTALGALHGQSESISAAPIVEP